MNNLKNLFLIGLALLNSLCLQAQSQEQLLETYCKVFESFSNNTQLAYKATFLMYDDLENMDVSNELLMDYRVLGKEFYCQFETYELYRKGIDLVCLDDFSKRINFIRDETGEQLQPGLTLEQMKAWIKFLGLEAESYVVDGDLVGIRFLSKDKTKSVIAMEYDPQTLHVHRTLCAMDLSNYSLEERKELDVEFDNKKMEVKFYDFKVSNIVFPTYMKKMIQKKDKPTSGKYANYEVNHF